MTDKYEARRRKLKLALGLPEEDWEGKMREYLLTCTKWANDCINSYYYGEDVESPCNKATGYSLTARFTARRMIKERAFKTWLAKQSK